MFESKSWVFLFLISAIIGIGYAAHYFSSVDSANAALLETKSKIADMNELLFQRKKSWADLEKLSLQSREVVEKNNILLKAKEILDKRYRTVEGDLNYAVDSSKTAIEKARNSAPGTELGDITLANGKVLRAAKVRKVEESGISMIHSDGIGMISLELLPVDLKERYDLGPDALIPLLQTAQTEFLAKKPTIANATVKPRSSTHMSSAPAAEEPAKTSVDDAKVKAIKLKMAELDSRMETYKRTAEQYREQAAKHEGLAQAAKSRGAPSTRHTTDASTILAQASQMERQADTMREERKKLEVELEYASKPK
jgi:hypothetical protein